MKKTLLAVAALTAIGALYWNAGDAQRAVDAQGLVPEASMVQKAALAPLTPQAQRELQVIDSTAAVTEPAAKPVNVIQAPTVEKRVAGKVLGRVLLMDGTPLGGLKVVARLSKDPEDRSIASTRSDEDGHYTLRFRKRDADETVVIFASKENDFSTGAVVPDIPVGATGVEVRIDAIDVRLLPPAGGQLGADLSSKLFLGVQALGGESVEKPFQPYWYQASEEGKSPRLLQAGPGYLIRVHSGKPGKADLMVQVPEGLASGRYEFELSSDQPGMASYQVSFTGEEFGADASQELSVYLSREEDEAGKKTSVELHGSLQIPGGGARTQTQGACLPGISSVSARFSDHGALGWYYATCHPEEIRLAAGMNSELVVDIQKGGRLATTIAAIQENGDREPVKGMLAYRYADASVGGQGSKWQHLNAIAETNPDTWELTGFLEPGRRFATSVALPAGRVEFRLTCRGYEPVETTLTISPSQFTEWSVELTPL